MKIKNCQEPSLALPVPQVQELWTIYLLHKRSLGVSGMNSNWNIITISPWGPLPSLNCHISDLHGFVVFSGSISTLQSTSQTDEWRGQLQLHICLTRQHGFSAGCRSHQQLPCKHKNLVLAGAWWWRTGRLRDGVRWRGFGCCSAVPWGWLGQVLARALPCLPFN